MSTEKITQISLKANEELVKRTKRKQSHKYYMIGRRSYVNKASKHTKADWQFEGIDFIDHFYAMSNIERYIVKLMKDHFKWDEALNSFNYEIKLAPDSVEFDESLPDTIKYETFLKGYSSLFKKDLMRRTKRHHYMFNPAFFLPAGDASTHFELLWHSAKAPTTALKELL